MTRKTSSRAAVIAALCFLVSGFFLFGHEHPTKLTHWGSAALFICMSISFFVAAALQRCPAPITKSH